MCEEVESRVRETSRKEESWGIEVKAEADLPERQ